MLRNKVNNVKKSYLFIDDKRDFGKKKKEVLMNLHTCNDTQMGLVMV